MKQIKAINTKYLTFYKDSEVIHLTLNIGTFVIDRETLLLQPLGATNLIVISKGQYQLDVIPRSAINQLWRYTKHVSESQRYDQYYIDFDKIDYSRIKS